MRWKSKFYVKELDRVFTNGSLLDAHISRVAVLYEDLRLEMMAASEVSLPTLDTIGMEHRRIYFARRSIGTLRELAEAIRLLDELPEFHQSGMVSTRPPLRYGPRPCGSFDDGNPTLSVFGTTSVDISGCRRRSTQ